MTMSVGLARIVSDPEATTLTRKALGALSTPGLLCYDNGLSIDDTGRFVIKLKSGGKIQQDADGLSLEITIGIDSHVDLVSDEYDREWNARLTGTAPNFIESRLDIGTEGIVAEASGITALGLEVEPSKVNITATGTQLRLLHDATNFVSQRLLVGGLFEQWCIGNRAELHLITGDGAISPESGRGGFRINGGSQIEIIEYVSLHASFTGGGVVGGVSWEENTFTLSPVLYPVDQTVISGGPKETSGLPTQIMSWSLRLSADNTVGVRIAWFDVLAPVSITFLASLHRFKA